MAPWNSEESIRSELFSKERFEQHAESLARAQLTSQVARPVPSLYRRLKENELELLAAYRSISLAVAEGKAITPAAEWLVNNSHIVEELIDDVRQNFPQAYYRRLPKVAGGPFDGYPRVYAIAWAFVAHTDSRFDADLLEAFIIAYQRVSVLTIGELWALPTSIRLVLVENLRRAARRISDSRQERILADMLVDGTIREDSWASFNGGQILLRDGLGRLRQSYLVQLLQRLRDIGGDADAAIAWLESQLHDEGLTIDQIVSQELHGISSTNNTVRHIIPSMRAIPDTDWQELVERVSRVDQEFAVHPTYREMDFPTRNAYRDVVEELSRSAPLEEFEVARAAVRLAAKAEPGSRASEPGFYLLSGGLKVLKSEIGFRYGLRERVALVARKGGLAGMAASVWFLTTIILGVPLLIMAGHHIAPSWLWAAGIMGLLPAIELAMALVQQAIMHEVRPRIVPALRLKSGVPDEARTLVAIPALITSKASIDELIGRIEVHHLATHQTNVFFALLTDWKDADHELLPADLDLLAHARAGIAELNSRHPGPSVDEPRFYLLHRGRRWNEGERCWMGWERKRGKLHELNGLLRGATDTSYLVDPAARPAWPVRTKFVITLDSDTRLPRDAATRLIGKMCHPLNRPVFSQTQQRVVDGYAILQPRVTPTLPTEDVPSLFQQLYASHGGIDPYAGAISDIYQDVFAEGSFTGKGIYDIDAFEAATVGRFPDNTVLSHDLLEGIYTRAGLATDIEVVEDFPARYDVARSRDLRWARGDWQLLPWILFGRADWVHSRSRRAADALPALGRWKLVDNLRRTLTPLAMVAALAVGWCLPLASALLWSGYLLMTIVIPAFLSILADLARPNRQVTLLGHLSRLGDDAVLAVARSILYVIVLSDRAYSMADAIIRTMYRLLVSRRHLLEWTTAAQAKAMAAGTTRSYYRTMIGGVALGAVALADMILGKPMGAAAGIPITFLWLAAPAIARFVSFRPAGAVRETPTPETERQLRLIGRATWRFFEECVTPEDNDLPPDNLQESPRRLVAHRTSPTNIGLYLLSTTCAREFGWISTFEAAERLERSVRTLARLERFNGHFFNWYDTRTLEVLAPRYISTVDSGNLAAHLVAVAEACRSWADQPPTARSRQGVRDLIELVKSELGTPNAATGNILHALETCLTSGRNADDRAAVAPMEWAMLHQAAQLLEAALAHSAAEPAIDGIRLLIKEAEEGRGDPQPTPDRARALNRRLLAIADTADYLASTMDFKFLLDPERQLLSIGYSVDTDRRDEGCYDLLASECRLTTFLCVAKGDLESRHWFRLGRPLTPLQGGSVLLSWSGSMFEYLMPEMVLMTPPDSLLGSTVRSAIRAHVRFGRKRSVPWGVSESAYNARDLELNYQYSAFGVPMLGLKRDLGTNNVVAPYATGLASMVRPNAAAENFAMLRKLGARGRLGFYEAVDFTPSRVPVGAKHEVILSYMAHHQAMTIVAIANALLHQRIARLFHANPMIQAAELLLQERAPRAVPRQAQRATLMRVRFDDDELTSASVRKLGPQVSAMPDCHILSNGSLSVLVSSSGAGYTAWKGLSVTRWHADQCLEDVGSFIYVRDRSTGLSWSIGQEPVPRTPEDYQVTFEESRVQLKRRDGAVSSTLDIIVAPEDAATCRRVTLANTGTTIRTLDVTTYEELVLGNRDADTVHPAFSKLFVETIYDETMGALLATRRRREPSEPGIVAATFLTADEDLPTFEYETDRSRFIGRNRTLAAPRAVVSGLPLAGSTGAVLDPIFALRTRVTLAPGSSVRLHFWTLVAADRAELPMLVEKYKDRSAYARAATLGWTQGLVELRHFGIAPEEAFLFQRLAGALLYASPCLRASGRAIQKGAHGYSALWSIGLSGDRPICLVSIDEIGDIGLIRQLLHAFEYWRNKGANFDLVILNTRSTSYQQDLQQALEQLCHAISGRHRLTSDQSRGSIVLLRADLISQEARFALAAAARAVFHARSGLLAEQLQSAEDRARAVPPPTRRVALQAVETNSRAASGLEFFNGLGGFHNGGRDYVVVLHAGQVTPAPWINVIANQHFGCHASVEGAGYTWCMNSRERQITPWSNDPVINRPGEVIYVRDEHSGELWTPTASPIRDHAAPYKVTHGQGYSCYEHTSRGIELRLDIFVAKDDPIKISRLRLRNVSGRERRLSVTTYVEWMLGAVRDTSAPQIITEYDPRRRAILAHNPWHTFFPRRTAFSCLPTGSSAWTADRAAFIGHRGGLDNPAGLAAGRALPPRAGVPADPCAVLQTVLTLQADGETEVVALLGDADDKAQAQALIERYTAVVPDTVLADVKRQWDDLLGAIQIKTPDRALDLMVNRWLPYQTIACRLWGRSGFYQASGAYGFRDQLQDALLLSLLDPDLARDHILKAASHQFEEGDVLHWWLEPSGHGIRTRISDGRLWLAFVTAHYVGTTGDRSILDEMVPFINGPKLGAEQHELYLQPETSAELAPVYEHCARALDFSLDIGFGANGLALIGGGDWNDGMNRVGSNGRGESVWLSWFLARCIADMLPIAASRGDSLRQTRWHDQRGKLLQAVEARAWDGEWYKRATFDNGEWIGSASNAECRIDAISQSWSVLSGGGDRDRSQRAMASVKRELVDADAALSRLFTPPFDQSEPDPGYIRAYPAGIRENGGQYTHAEAWNVIAHTMLGDGDSAGELLSIINPINHTSTTAGAARYRLEPYVIAADVGSVGANRGRGGWSWYTGSAGWIYRAAVEFMLGVRRQGSELIVQPVIPRNWSGFEVVYRHAGTTYTIEVLNPNGSVSGVLNATIDGQPLSIRDGSTVVVPLRANAGELQVRLVMSSSSLIKAAE